MRKAYVFILMLLLVVPGVLATAGSVDYQIIGDKVLVELRLDEVSDFRYNLPFDAETVEANVDYELVDFDNYKVLKIDYGKNIRVDYITDAFIEKSKNKYFFILKNQFDYAVDMNLFLDEGAVLAEENRLIIPEPTDIATDGRRIILEWEDFNSGEIVVEYELIEEGSSILWIVVFLVVLLWIAFYFKKSRKIKKEVKKAKGKLKFDKKKKVIENKKRFTRNLFGEEKKIIEYLLDKKGKECWTKELVRELGISKVRLSRRLRNLEQKELVMRIPYGNENKIRLKK